MINLLPPKQKEELKLRRVLVIINTLGMIIFAVLVVFLLCLTIAKFFADGLVKSKEIENEGVQRQLEIMEVAQIEKQMNSYNNLCRVLNNFYSKQNSAAAKITTIANSLPEGITLTQMALNDNTISIGGLSKNREALTKMQSNLENLSDIDSVIIPPSAWVEENNSKFDAIIKYNDNENAK